MFHLYMSRSTSNAKILKLKLECRALNPKTWKVNISWPCLSGYQVHQVYPLVIMAIGEILAIADFERVTKSESTWVSSDFLVWECAKPVHPFYLLQNWKHFVCTQTVIRESEPIWCPQHLTFSVVEPRIFSDNLPLSLLTWNENLILDTFYFIVAQMLTIQMKQIQQIELICWNINSTVDRAQRKSCKK